MQLRRLNGCCLSLTNIHLDLNVGFHFDKMPSNGCGAFAISPNNKMAWQIVKEQLKLFTNQLQASARQWQQILDFQLGDLWPSPYPPLSPSPSLGPCSCDGGSCESKIKQSAKNCVILMSLNVNQTMEGLADNGERTQPTADGLGKTEVALAAAEMVQSLWQLCHRSCQGKGKGNGQLFIQQISTSKIGK